jgi:hypothetical protein
MKPYFIDYLNSSSKHASYLLGNFNKDEPPLKKMNSLRLGISSKTLRDEYNTENLKFTNENRQSHLKNTDFKEKGIKKNFYLKESEVLNTLGVRDTSNFPTSPSNQTS